MPLKKECSFKVEIYSGGLRNSSRSKSSYSVKIQEVTDQKNSGNGYFSLSDNSTIDNITANSVMLTENETKMQCLLDFHAFLYFPPTFACKQMDLKTTVHIH